MLRSVARPSRRSFGVLAGIALAVAFVISLAVWRPWTTTNAAVSIADAGATGAVAVAALDLPEDPTVLVFGDSWTYGSAATPITSGYAYVLAGLIDGETIVDGVRGSGYLVPGAEGIGTFGERIARLDTSVTPDAIIVQGSINDRRVGAEGYEAAVNAAWDALSAAYPGVPIVILGPAPQVLPIEAATSRIDASLSSLAAARGWPYISPIAADWITSANYLDVIDTSDYGADHPSVEGHAYLAERLAAALTALAP